MRGPDDDPFVDRSLESERGPAQIANRRETAHQRVRGLIAGDQIGISNIIATQCAGVGRTSIVCQCMSISPGISVRPPPSISDGVGAAIGRDRSVEMRSILFPRTSTLLGPDRVSLLPSKMRTF